MRSRQIPTPAVQPALDTETATRLRAAIGRLSRRLRTTAAGRAAGLTPTRISLLLNVDRNGPVRLSELAASEGINPTMLSRVVADLVEQGLLERTSDPGDRRAALVEATPAGRRARASGCAASAPSAVNAAMVALRERGATPDRAGAARARGARRGAQGATAVTRVVRAGRVTFAALSVPNYRRYYRRPGDLADRHLDADDRAVVAGADA